MFAFFRRILSSWVAVAILGLVMVAFIVTGVGTQGGGISGGPRADDVATVGGKPITIPTLASRAEGELRVAAQQQPGLTMPAFLAAIGGVGTIVEQYIGAQVLSGWAEKEGMRASDRLVGGEIGSIPAFQGPDGKFDPRQMQALLQQQRISETSLKDDIRSDLLRRQLVTPISSDSKAPAGLLQAYAVLLTNRREGAIGLVPARPDGLPAPTDAEINAWYATHLAAYSLPERRVVRYAPFGPETVTVTPPSAAEVAAAYMADAAKYAASETRVVSQVVLPDEAAARAFAAKVAAGAPFAKAAADGGFAAADIALGDLTKPALAASASPPIAAAAFALPKGGTTAPIKTALGFAIVHVDAVTAHGARSLAQAQGEIAAALTRKKAQAALAAKVEAIQDAVSDGANFTDIAAKQKLAVITTPPLLPNGAAPTVPGFRPDATLTALMKAANQLTPDDEPSVETVGGEQHYALLGVASVIPAAPLPIQQVKDRIVADMMARRAADRARATAQSILAKVNGGQPIAAAFAAARLPAPQIAGATQVDLARAGDRVPPPLRALFRLTAGKGDVVPAPDGGWFVVRLDRIVPGDARMLPAIVAATRTELSGNLGEEYAAQFAAAARAVVPVRRSPAGLAKLDRQLRGAASPDAGQ